MSKQTVWLVVIFLGFSFCSIWFSGTNGLPPPLALLGDVGLTVGVAPNPYNTLAEQLNDEQTNLNNESSSLAAREAALQSSSAETGVAAAPRSNYLAAGIIVVAGLLIVNFYWDWRRSRREAAENGQHPI